MAKKYIAREAVLKYIEETNTDAEWLVNQYNADWIYSFLDSIPAADVKEVVHGVWIEGKTLEKCSICGKKGFPDWNYCPNCGADMRGHKE